MYKDFTENDLNTNTFDKQAIEQSIRNIVLTKRGSLVGKPDFGCGIYYYLFEQIYSITAASMEDTIKTALRKFEPRIKVKKVNVFEQPEYNRIILSINYEYTFVKTENYETYNIILKR